MISKSLQHLCLLLSALPGAFPQLSNKSAIACNNSPHLCSRAYNNITHLGAHDSPFLRALSTWYSLSGDQSYDTATQLAAGVRLVTAQVHLFRSRWHLCHTSCELLNAGLLRDWLAGIKRWLDQHPHEVVTVLLVNSDGADAGQLGAEYEAAGVRDYAYTPTPAMVATHAWPTLLSLIDHGSRLVTFVASLGDNVAAPYLMDEFTYIFENRYENLKPADFSCAPDRPSSVAGDTDKALNQGLMPLMNHFLYEKQPFGIEIPNASYVGTTNAPSGGAGSLGAATTACTNAYGRPPAFVLVDFFGEGPAIETVDRLNGVTEPVGRKTVSTKGSAWTGAGAANAARDLGTLCLTFWPRWLSLRSGYTAWGEK